MVAMRQALKGIMPKGLAFLAATAGKAGRPAMIDHVHSSLGIEQVLFSLRGANANVTTDQILTKSWSFTNYLITDIRYCNASISLTTASGGIYDAAAKAGTPIVANAALSGMTGPTIGVRPTIAAAGLDEKTAASLILALTTAQGAPSTFDVFVIGVPLT